MMLVQVRVFYSKHANHPRLFFFKHLCETEDSLLKKWLPNFRGNSASIIIVNCMCRAGMGSLTGAAKGKCGLLNVQLRNTVCVHVGIPVKWNTVWSNRGLPSSWKATRVQSWQQQSLTNCLCVCLYVSVCAGCWGNSCLWGDLDDLFQTAASLTGHH